MTSSLQTFRVRCPRCSRVVEVDEGTYGRVVPNHWRPGESPKMSKVRCLSSGTPVYASATPGWAIADKGADQHVRGLQAKEEEKS